MSAFRAAGRASRATAFVIALAGLTGPAFVLAQTCNAFIPESTPTTAFTFPGDLTTTDSQTGLMWKQCAEGQVWNGSTCSGTGTAYSWQNALLLVKSTNESGGFAGFTDWRLPNLKELRSIVEERCHTPSINVTAFPGTPAQRFWSSTPDNFGDVALTEDKAWPVDFATGEVVRLASKTSPYRVRLVRAGRTFDAYDSPVVNLASGTNPSARGQSVTLTATVAGVAPSGSVEGAVAFLDGATAISGCASVVPVVGVATCPISSLALGNHTITASYSGDSRNIARASAAVTQVVNQAVSSTALGTSLSPSVFGQAVTLTATVTGFAPTGTVAFLQSGVAIPSCGSQPVTGSVATCTTSVLTVGVHSLTASYSGNVDNTASVSPPISQSVNLASTTTAISAHTPDPSAIGSPVTVTAGVAVVAPGSGTPAGTITVSDGAVNCVITLPATTCNLSPTSLGARTLVATYSGGAGFNGSVSPGVGHAVGQATSSTALGSSANPSDFGQSVTFTATISGYLPTGTVAFANLPGCAAVAVSSGQAACTTSALALGSHSVTATYSGDANNLGSSSITLVQSVVSGTSTALASSPNPSTFGQGVNLTATVTGASPTGTVTFRDGASAIAGCNAVPLSGIQAVCVTTALGGGSRSLTARYSGDPDDGASTSPIVTQVVNPANQAIAFGAAPTVVVGGTGAVSATGGGSGNPVNFTSQTPGTCTVSGATVAGVAAGACTIAADQAGNANYNPAPQVTQGFAIGKGNQSIVFGAPPTVAAGGTGTVSATGGASGNPVVFTSQTPGICTVSGATVTGVAAGTCTIAADQAGNANYNAAAQVTQSFAISQPVFALTIALAGGGSGTVTSTPAGIDCGATCVAGFINGTLVTLAASPAAGSIFSGWSGGGCSGTGTCDVTVNAATTVTATFALATSIPRLANISTRGRVETGNDVMIGGFIIGGPTAKKVLITARGPSLTAFGVTGAMANPALQLFSGQTVIAANDDWQTNTNAADITATGIAPTNPLESALLLTLAPGAYTVIVSGVGGGMGVGIVEVFEMDRPDIPLINISTRGQVQTGDNVMIGGFIIYGDAPKTVLITARGPSLAPFGITNPLANPSLQLFSGQTVIASNDDFGTAPNLVDIQATGVAPTDSRESAILVTLSPGAYTAIVTGVEGGTGVGIIEVFAR